MNSPYSKYFEDWDVKPSFRKEFVSLWSGWLGEANLHNLDEVTENEWARFNQFIRLIAKEYVVEIADCESESIRQITNIESTLANYEESMNKESTSFSKYVLPELACVVSEEWDYTYIIWHKNNGALEALSPIVKMAGLKHFNE
jgi:hypothetical protein